MRRKLEKLENEKTAIRYCLSSIYDGFMYPGTELNRHSHCCERDFKSRVSTNSTTRVCRE